MRAGLRSGDDDWGDNESGELEVVEETDDDEDDRRRRILVC